METVANNYYFGKVCLGGKKSVKVKVDLKVTTALSFTYLTLGYTTLAVTERGNTHEVQTPNKNSGEQFKG